jgi:DNA-binding MarR family transcriptional regulator
MPTEIDPHIHPPARLRLVTMLTAVTEVEFVTLRQALEVSDSVLSKHLSALAEVGYVRSRKGTREGRRTTWIALTNEGRRALVKHAAALRAMLEGVETGSADAP